MLVCTKSNKKRRRVGPTCLETPGENTGVYCYALENTQE